jgi:hypothetical protein
MKVKILDLRPTQMAIGMLEVAEKLKQYKKFSKKELKKELKGDPLEVVIAPNGYLYITDGHHTAMALWLAGEKKTYIKIAADYSKRNMSYDSFWKLMKKKRLAHLYDQFGVGPHDPIYLAKDIRGLGDDPYRSLAWLVGKKGGFKETKSPFEKFRWANFFRERRVLSCDFKPDYKQATERAIKVAHRPSAKQLPGYQKEA